MKKRVTKTARNPKQEAPLRERIYALAESRLLPDHAEYVGRRISLYKRTGLGTPSKQALYAASIYIEWKQRWRDDPAFATADACGAGRETALAALLSTLEAMPIIPRSAKKSRTISRRVER